MADGRRAIVPRSLRGWVLPAALLALWWAARRFGWSQSPLLVSPGLVWDTAVRQIVGGDLWVALGASLWRDLAGLLLGVAAGLVVGLLLGLSRPADRLLGPSLHTLKQISLFAWLPLLSLWFGLGDQAKVAFVALASFFPVALNTIEGTRATPPDLLDVARVLGWTRAQVLRQLVLPAAAPSIATGLRLALIYAWLATLGAEYLMVTGQGIGNLLIDGREHFWMDKVLFGVLVIGAVGCALNLLATRLETCVLSWRGAGRRVQ